jgi:hypothetical protein
MRHAAAAEDTFVEWQEAGRAFAEGPVRESTLAALVAPLRHAAERHHAMVAHFEMLYGGRQHGRTAEAQIEALRIQQANLGILSTDVHFCKNKAGTETELPP